MDTNTRTTGADLLDELAQAITAPMDGVQRDRARFRRPGPKTMLEQARRGRSRPQRIPVLPEALDYLRLPMRLDCDPPWRPVPGTDHPFGLGEYDRQGQPIPREPIEQGWPR